MEHRDSSSSSRSNGSNGRRNWKGNAAATTRPTPRQSSFPFGLHATPRGGGVKEAAELCAVGGKVNSISAAFNLIVISFVFITFAPRCVAYVLISLTCLVFTV